MNKTYDYKIGDKVILLRNIYGYKKNSIGKIIGYNKNGYKKNSIGKIIGYNNTGYIVNVINKTSTSYYKPSVWVNNDVIKYYYEKPLYDLFKKIVVHYPLIEKDHNVILPFIKLIESNKTLTDEQLIICQKMWEKYNR